jgi:hypothetical protein
MGESDFVFPTRKAITLHQYLNPVLICVSHCLRTALTKWLPNSPRQFFLIYMLLLSIHHRIEFPLKFRCEFISTFRRSERPLLIDIVLNQLPTVSAVLTLTIGPNDSSCWSQEPTLLVEHCHQNAMTLPLPSTTCQWLLLRPC